MKKIRFSAAWPVLFLLVVLILTCVTAWPATAILDGDMSGEMVLARVLHEEGKILSPRFAYANELLLVKAPALYALLFPVFTDWHMIRYVGTLILMLCMLLSWAYLNHQAGGDRKAFCLGGSLMLLPESIASGRIVLYHALYSSFIASAFLLIGLYLAIVRNKGKLPVKIIRWVVLLGFGFLSGLNGLRLVMTTAAPVALAVLWQVMAEQNASEKLLWRRALGWLLPMAVLAGSILAGCLYNILFYEPFFGFDEQSTFVRAATGKAFDTFFVEYLNLFGAMHWRGTDLVKNALTILAVPAAIGVTALPAFAMRKKELAAEKQFFNRYALSGIIVTALICALLQMPAGGEFLRLLMPVTILLYLTLALMLSEAELPGWQKAAGIFCFAVLLLCGVNNTRFFFTRDMNTWQYDGINFQNADLVEEMTEAADFLQAEGYDLGVMTYWMGNTMTEMTDGRVNTVAVHTDGQIYPWSSDKKYYEDRDFFLQHKVFLLADRDDLPRFEEAGMLEGSSCVWNDGSKWIYAWEDPAVLYDMLIQPE